MPEGVREPLCSFDVHACIMTTCVLIGYVFHKLLNIRPTGLPQVKEKCVWGGVFFKVRGKSANFELCQENSDF